MYLTPVEFGFKFLRHNPQRRLEQKRSRLNLALQVVFKHQRKLKFNLNWNFNFMWDEQNLKSQTLPVWIFSEFFLNICWTRKKLAWSALHDHLCGGPWCLQTYKHTSTNWHRSEAIKTERKCLNLIKWYKKVCS